MNELLALFIVAAVVEALWEALKPAIPQGLAELLEEKGIPFYALGPLALSLTICVTAQVDLLAMIGIPLGVSYLGSILTGALVARGSNFLHDLLQVINGVKRDKEPLKIEAGM